MTIFNLFSIFIVLISILLIGVILLQEPKESIATYGGSSAPVQRIGINPQADFLEKATWVLAGLLLLLALLVGLLLKRTPQSGALLSPNLAQLANPVPEENESDLDATATRSENNAPAANPDASNGQVSLKEK